MIIRKNEAKQCQQNINVYTKVCQISAIQWSVDAFMADPRRKPDRQPQDRG